MNHLDKVNGEKKEEELETQEERQKVYLLFKCIYYVVRGTGGKEQ